MKASNSLDAPTACIQARLGDWVMRYGLTERQAEVLSSAATVQSRVKITTKLGITLPTLRKHTENILRKTGDDALATAANRLLYEALIDACRKSYRRTP